MKRTFLVKKDPTIEAQDNWLIMDYRQYAAWRETDEGKNREIVFGKFEACSEDDSIIFMECNEKVSKELKKDCHRKQYIRSRDAETPFQVMSYSTMTFQESEIYGEDVLEDTECNVEESVMQRMDIERVRTALKMLTPERYDWFGIENAPAEAGAGMKLHHGIFQQVFHIAAENTGQLVEDVCLRLVNAIDPLFVHLNVAQIHAGLLCKLCLR